MVVKLGLMATVPLYVLVGWWLTTQPATVAPMDAETLGIMSKAMIAIYAAIVLLVEPVVSRTAVVQMGGYGQKTMLLRLALFETGAIFGLLLTLLSHDPSYVMVFGALAFVLMAVRAPVPR